MCNVGLILQKMIWLLQNTCSPKAVPIRGGTDGAQLSFKGLPCPNLGTGGFNFHGPFECITVEKMDQCVEVLLNLVELYKA